MPTVRGVRLYTNQPPQVVKADFSQGIGRAIDPEGSVQWGELVRLTYDVLLYVDEEGRLKGSVPTMYLPNVGVLCGPVLAVGDDHEGNERDLTDAEVESVVALFSQYSI